MGVLDFDSVFDILDPTRKGFLTIDQVFHFDQTIHFTPLAWDQTQAAVEYVCGNNNDGRIQQQHFVELLHELERRRTLEEKVRWDFMSMDESGNNRLSILNTLALFKLTHEDRFSLRTWQRFLASREDAMMDVYWDEVKLWLCAIPTEEPSTDADINNERERLSRAKEGNLDNEYKLHMETKDDDRLSTIHRQEYQDKTKRLARRKFNRWEEEGVEGVIYDDGRDTGEVIPTRTHDYLGLNDLLDALDLKYDLLRKALFQDMLIDQFGESTWNAMRHDEKSEAYHTLQFEEKEMRKAGTLSTKGIALYGARVNQDRTLKGLIGTLKDSGKAKLVLNERRTVLKDRGLTDIQIDGQLRAEFIQQEQGPVHSLNHLVALAERQETEREILLSYKKSDNKNKLSAAQIVTEYCRLLHEHHLARIELSHTSAATAVGLAERDQMFRPERFELDRERQEILARERLTHFQPENIVLPWEEGEGAKVKSIGEIDLQVDVVKEITWKHALERIILIQLLQGPESSASKAAGKKMSSDQWTNKLSYLRNQRNAWRDSSAVFMTSQRQHHLTIIQEGVGVYHTMKTSERELLKLETGDEAVNAAVLADLQEKQYQEMAQSLLHMQRMGEKDIAAVKKAHKAARQQEHLDNLASVLLGTFELSDEEKPYLEALDFKYQALRVLLMRHELRLEHGVGWERLGDKEQSKLLNKKLGDELKLRTDGKLADMVALLTRMPQDIGSVRGLMGEDKAEFTKRIARVYAKQGADSDPDQDNDTDEVPASNVKSINLLADLQRRFYAEQDCLIGQLRSHDSLGLTDQEKLLHLVSLKVETKKAEREDSFDQGAMDIGLFERVLSALETRHKSDRSRQMKLAQLRYDSRKRRLATGRPRHAEMDDYARPEKNDIAGWMDASLREIDKKHVEEREILLSVLQDASMEELCEVARGQSSEDLQKRLVKLKYKRKQMDMEKPDEREENISVIEEAAAIRTVLNQRLLQEVNGHGQTVTPEEVAITLLCELQDEQDREMAEAVSQISKKTQAEMKIIREYEINSRHWKAGENVVLILTKYEGSANDDDLVKALDDKYRALEDKLLQDGLTSQEGTSQLSTADLEERLSEVKRKVRRLEAQGNMEEVASIQSGGQKTEAELAGLLGCIRADLDSLLIQHEERRNKQGETVSGSLDEAEGREDTSALVALLNRRQHEKKMLFLALEGGSGVCMSWRERQTELLRLLWQTHMATEEEHVVAAMLAVGLSERQQIKPTIRLKKDKARQEQLASLKLKSAKEKTRKSIPNNTVEKDGTLPSIQWSVLKRLAERQAVEQYLLADLSTSKLDQLLIEISVNSTEDERLDRLEDIAQRRKMLRATPNKIKENRSILLEAFTVRRESCRHNLSPDGATASNDAVTISLLSQLQDRHNQETENWILMLGDKSQQELVNLQVELLSEIKQQIADNLAAILLAQDKVLVSDDLDAVIKALDSKYDTLRDKLIAEALMNQMGEAEWKKLSEQERQRRKAELRLKEKQLRKEGCYEEAAALLGESLKNHELLEMMLGSSREEQAKRLQERLDRRKQRLAQGMSEEECDELEQQEIEEEKKKRNILLDLQGNYDAEKAELLARLQAHEDRLSQEQRRQLELARLMREQRRARREEKFDAAALMLGLAQQHEKVLENNRQQQEKLARARLEARLAQMRGKASKGYLQPVESSLQGADGDIGSQEALIQELEKKHDEEREVMMQLFVDPKVEKERSICSKMTEEELEAQLASLSKSRQQWKLDEQSNPQTQINILVQATAAQMELLKHGADGDNSPADPQIMIMADLQQAQDEESRHLLNDLTNKSKESLKQLQMVQSAARRQYWYDNVARAVLGGRSMFSGDDFTADETELVKALENKYDTLRDKLLADALIKQIGEADWKKLSEQERQNRLARIRLEEKKLRKEGRFDEAALLLGKLRDNEEELLEKLGESRLEQKKRVAARLERKRQLLAEREEKGLSADEAVIEAILDQEESLEAQQHPRKNILEGLQSQFEEEKAALLASLRDQDSRLASERLRQLELAKLRREEKRLAQEDKFHTAALLMNSAKQQGEQIEASILRERERHKELARERLAARKQKRNGDSDEAKVKQDLMDFDADSDMADALLETRIAEEGIVALQESILQSVEEKQDTEKQLLEDLVFFIEKDSACKQFADSTDSTQVRVELEKLRQEHVKWRNRSRMLAAANASAASLSAGQLLQKASRISKSRKEQFQLLSKAMALKIKVEKEKAGEKWMTASDFQEELLVNLLADLQQIQGAETSALHTTMEDKDEDVLRNLRSSLLVGAQEGWYENVPRVVFAVSQSTPEHIANIDDAAIKQEMEQEFIQEKEDLKQKLARQGDAVDVEVTMARLQAEQSARRQAMEDALERHKRLAEDKLAARRIARDNREFEHGTAAELLRQAEKQSSFIIGKKEEQQSRQNDLMQQKLAARREERQRANQQQGSPVDSPSSSRPSTSDSLSLPPGMRMKREKTAMDVALSDDQKNEMYMQLVREQTIVNRRLSMEHRRHEDRLKQRLTDMKDKKVSEASALIALGERQRTTLEKQRKEKQEKQLSATKERIARLRYEKTMTMKEKADINAKKFDELVDKQDLSEDDRMTQAAKRIEENLRKGDTNQRKSSLRGNTTLPTLDEAEGEEGEGGKAITEQPAAQTNPDKMKAIKARLEQRKQKKKQGKNE